MQDVVQEPVGDEGGRGQVRRARDGLGGDRPEPQVEADRPPLRNASALPTSPPTMYPAQQGQIGRQREAELAGQDAGQRARAIAQSPPKITTAPATRAAECRSCSTSAPSSAATTTLISRVATT